MTGVSEAKRLRTGATESVALLAQSVSRSYPTPSGELVVLREASLAVEAGQAVAIMGPSGAGKSTFLHILGTLERPSAGRVWINGIDPFELDPPETARFRNRTIGFVFQDHHLLPQCSAIENVLLPTLASRENRDGLARANRLLERVGLAQRRDHRPAELSGGERQRAALARALINQPAVVLADEPTGNLDPRSADEVSDLLLELPGSEDVVLVCVTHSQRLAQRFPRRYELIDGRLRAAP